MSTAALSSLNSVPRALTAPSYVTKRPDANDYLEDPAYSHLGVAMKVRPCLLCTVSWAHHSCLTSSHGLLSCQPLLGFLMCCWKEHHGLHKLIKCSEAVSEPASSKVPEITHPLAPGVHVCLAEHQRSLSFAT